MSFNDFLLDHYRVYRSTGAEVRIDCPFCGDHKGHGYANTEKNVFICHRCHASSRADRRGHTAYSFLRAEGLSHRDARRILGGEPVPVLHRRKQVPPELKEVSLPESWKPVSRCRSYLGRKAWDYLYRRLGAGLESIVQRYRIGYCTGGPMAGRIILPVTVGGRLVYYQARTFYPRDAEPKYTASSTPKPLFGLEGVQPGQHLTLVEGWFDRLALGDCAVTVFGSSLSDLQVRMLYGARPGGVTVCFDPDEAGQKGAMETARKLLGWLGSEIYVVRGMEVDPADLGPQAALLVQQKRVRFEAGVKLF